MLLDIVTVVPKEKRISLHCFVATSFQGRQTWPAHSSSNHLYYLSVTAALLEGGGAPWKVRGSWTSQSISVCRAIDCDLVRGAGDGGVPFWWAIGGNPLTPSTWQAEAGAMMRGQGQLVGVTGGWMEAMVGLHGSQDRRCQIWRTKPPNQPPESITGPIHHPSSFVGSITVAS